MTSCATSDARQQTLNANVISKQVADLQKKNQQLAAENAYKASQTPPQPDQCGKRITANLKVDEGLDDVAKSLYIALKTSNDQKLYCYQFNEKIRKDRLNAKRTSTK